MINLFPLEDNVLIELIEVKDVRESGLVIPDTAKEKSQEGTVVAVGPGKLEGTVRVPVEISIGDVVVYRKYGGTEYEYDGKSYIIISARDVLLKISKGKK